MSEAPKPATPSQHQLRAKLEEMVIRDLLGPMEGDDEVAERSVRERYLVGILAPSRKGSDDQSTVPFYDECKRADCLPRVSASVAPKGTSSSPFACPTAVHVR